MQGCPKLPNGSPPLVCRSSPYYEDMWRRYCCLTSFFPIVDTCLSCEDIARQSCAVVPKWRFLSDFLRPAFPATCVQHISDLHSKFALRPHHVMVRKYGRHPVCMRPLRLGEEKRKKKETTWQKYNVRICYATPLGHIVGPTGWTSRFESCGRLLSRRA